MKWVGAPTTAPVAAATAAAGATLVDGDGFLLPEIVDRVEKIMRRRGLTKTGSVMREMGLTPLNGVLGSALRNHPVRPGSDLIRALEKWLDDNKSH